MTATDTAAFGLAFDNSYARELAGAYQVTSAAVWPAPTMVRFNHALAARLGLDAGALDSSAGARLLSGMASPDITPIALAYAGHQFGHFSPQLGDGRALLLGEIVDAGGARFDVHLKGSGRTPYSRGGDGRAALGPVLREYLMSEALAALAIPTTRTLAAVATGEQVRRDTALPGAVLVRVAASHLRIGTLEYFAAQNDVAMVGRLVRYALARHDPHGAPTSAPALTLLTNVIERQAQLIAHWMLVGFIHGVMNTDNMTLSGETIDYGPCAMMDSYDPATVYSSIDTRGRYAYQNQPGIAQWNLARLAQALMPLIANERPGASEQDTVDVVNGTLEVFSSRFAHHWLVGMRHKLGLVDAQPDDAALADGLLALLHAQQMDYTRAFVALQDVVVGDDARFVALASEPAACGAWLAQYRARIGDSASARVVLRRTNPRVIARNHRVHEALQAAEAGDLALFDRALVVLSQPFADYHDDDPWMTAPSVQLQRQHRTFCGT